MSAAAIRVVVYEDNKNLRLSLYQLINSQPGFACVGAFEHFNALAEQMKALTPDVVLMDIGMPGMSGIEAVKLISAHFPEVRVLMQTVFDDDDKIFHSILAGASGYILKNTPGKLILKAIRDAFEGGSPMTPSIATKVWKMVIDQPMHPSLESFQLSEREKEVLDCLVRGMSYKLIADSCEVSIDTVRAHIKSIYEKLHVHSKGEAIAIAIKGNHTP